MEAVTDHEVVELIIGRSLTATFPPKPEPQFAARPVLSVADLCRRDAWQAHRSIFGQARFLALPGCRAWGSLSCSWRSSATSPMTGGSIASMAGQLRCTAPSDAVAANIGFALVPEDRKTEGLFLKLDGRRNASLARHPPLHPSRPDRRRGRTGGGRRRAQRVQVDERALYARAGAFSGGNQQKIVLAKWIWPAAGCCCCSIRRVASMLAPSTRSTC